MATPEALIKYYRCLKDSFDKIQLKNNKTALVNAALRPKIRDEIVRDPELLTSYLDYLKVFTIIYSDKFPNVSMTVICPLFRDIPLSGRNKSVGDNERIEDNTAEMVHQTLRIIFKSKPEFIDEFVHTLVRLFPNIISDDEEVFSSYLSNAIEVCTYIQGEPLKTLVARILDRVNPPDISEEKGKETKDFATIIKSSYDLIYDRLDSLNQRQVEDVSEAIFVAFIREFLTSKNEDAMNYLLLYICSKNEKLADSFINLLWENFTDSERSLEERQASVLYACSFMSRASYINLTKIFSYIETAMIWYKNSVDGNNNISSCDRPTQCSELLCPLVESILYIITQRYREMYEEESINRLKKLGLEGVLMSPMKPLESCNSQTVSRYYEVATLYDIGSIPIDIEPRIKRRRSSNLYSATRKMEWKMPFKENCDFLPTRIKNFYLNYYDHRNFTVYRE